MCGYPQIFGGILIALAEICLFHSLEIHKLKYHFSQKIP